MTRPSILIVTGQSGSGKSTVVSALEDQGYFCVDNLPASLAEELVATVERNGAADHIALVMDLREREFLKLAPRLVERLRQGPYPTRLIYLEAQEKVLIRRYSETRRRHPLDRGDGLRAAISAEQRVMAPLRELADSTIDTSAMTPHVLRDVIVRRFAGVGVGDALRVGLLSFGFKNGVPLESDIVLDVRFLPNPYFVKGMREKTGLCENVRRYVVDTPEAGTFLHHTQDLLCFLIPQYQKEGKRYLTVAIGCTGGQHRSVALSCELAERLRTRGVEIDLRHRDLKEMAA